MEVNKSRERKIRPSVILVPTIILMTLIVIGIVNKDIFIEWLNACFVSLMINGGWLISLGTLFFVVFMIFIIFHPIGNVKLGGKDAKPEYNMWSWFAISLCSGVGTGIVFWGAVEPLKFAVTPQMSTGILPNTRESVIWAMCKSYLHWSFAPYATYAVFGVIIAFAYYNLHKSFNVSSGFSPLMGEKAEKTWFREIIDTLTVFALVGGVSGSLGYGLLQIGSGLNTVFSIPKGVTTYVIICVVIVIIYNISSISGIDKGIKWLSSKNAWIFIGLMLLTLFWGPTQWMCNLFVESIGEFLSTFVQSITSVSAFNDLGQVVGSKWHETSELWSQWWDQYYFVDFLSFGPIVGLFSIKLAKGRTLRQFAIMNWVVPSVFAIIWFTIFGALSLDIQYNYSQYASRVDLQGCATLFDYMTQYGNEAMMLKVIEAIPFAFLLKPLILVLIVLSFVTMADSMTSTISLMTIRNNNKIKEAPIAIKIFWGILMGMTALVFTLTGSIDGIKIIKTMAGFPILIIGIFMVIMYLIYIYKHRDDIDKMM